MRLETAVYFSCYPKNVFCEVLGFLQQGRELYSYGCLEAFSPDSHWLRHYTLHSAILNQNLITDERKVSKQKTNLHVGKPNPKWLLSTKSGKKNTVLPHLGRNPIWGEAT